MHKPKEEIFKEHYIYICMHIINNKNVIKIFNKIFLFLYLYVRIYMYIIAFEC